MRVDAFVSNVLNKLYRRNVMHLKQHVMHLKHFVSNCGDVGVCDVAQ